MADLEGTWVSAGGLTVAQLPYDSAGSLATVRVISEFLPEDAESAIGELVARHARPGGDPSSTVQLLLGDEGGPHPRRVRELRHCAPELRNVDFLRDLMVAEARSLSLVAARTTVRLYALVREDGSVQDVRIDRPSNNPAVDAAAVRVMRLAAFVPGRVEGMPTTVWVNFPVTFRLARRNDSNGIP